MRKIHMDALRLRAVQIAQNLGKGPEEHLLIAEKLADAHIDNGIPVIRTADEPSVKKHYTADGLARVDTIPLRRYNDSAFPETVQA